MPTTSPTTGTTVTSGSSPPNDPWLWASLPIPTDIPAVPIAVYKYSPSGSGMAAFLPLPNVVAISVHRAIGTDPGRASLRYVFDGRTPGAPQSIEQALSTAYNLPLTINPDDQIIIIAQRPDNTTQVVHHGRALLFGMRLAGGEQGGREEAVVGTVGIGKDLWSQPIGGQLMRDGANVASGADTPTSIPVQFNPKGKPSATPKAAWATGTPPSSQAAGGDFSYPTFLDANIVRVPDVRNPWTLATAARYLIFRHSFGAQPVQIPDGATLDQLLMAPPGGQGQGTDIRVSDRPLSGRDWPSALNELIRDRGFAMSFDLATGTDGMTPTTRLRLFGLQSGPIQSLYLQKRGSFLDPNLTNITAAEVDRDVTEVVNQWKVLGGMNRYEASFVLQAGFPMQSSDVGSMSNFTRNATNFASNSDAYRLFVFDETGEGHYAAGSSTVDKTIPSLDSILGSPDSVTKAASYVHRRRPAIGELFSLDSNGKPRRYQLAISLNYTSGPGVWDGSGKWQVVEGSFVLLRDRLGIRITADNPNAWKIGKSEDPNAVYPDGVVKVVESLATTSGVYNKPFSLRLTCVIEGDRALEQTATPTGNSPVTRMITRSIDARDRLAVEAICPSSPFFDTTQPTQGGVILSRDDTAAALAEATAAQAVTEAGVLQGPFTIPYFTLKYSIGDRIAGIVGRGLPLRTDGGAASPVYPVIVAIDHHLDGEQRTVLHVSDQDEKRVRTERRIGRGGHA